MSADGYISPARFDFELTPEVHNDVRTLKARSDRNPNDRYARNLFENSITALKALRNGHPGTKPLETMSHYPDLADCRTFYLGGDYDQKPSHRIVFRDRPPTHPGARPRREVLAIGEREAGRVYQTAGQRLGRPVGFTLAQLRELPEPAPATAPQPLVRPAAKTAIRTPETDHGPSL